MPAGNGRGPMGAGSMSGRGAGYCAGYSVPGCANPVRGGGYCGSGRGGGRGWKNRFDAAGMTFRGRGFRNFHAFSENGADSALSEFSAENELMILKKKSQFMKDEISAVNERIKTLESLSAGKKENI